MPHDDPFPRRLSLVRHGDSVTNPSIARSLNAIAASPGTQNNDRSWRQKRSLGQSASLTLKITVRTRREFITLVDQAPPEKFAEFVAAIG
jgi:hypothetical protein